LTNNTRTLLILVLVYSQAIVLALSTTATAAAAAAAAVPGTGQLAVEVAGSEWRRWVDGRQLCGVVWSQPHQGLNIIRESVLGGLLSVDYRVAISDCQPQPSPPSAPQPLQPQQRVELIHQASWLLQYVPIPQQLFTAQVMMQTVPASEFGAKQEAGWELEAHITMLRWPLVTYTGRLSAADDCAAPERDDDGVGTIVRQRRTRDAGT